MTPCSVCKSQKKSPGPRSNRLPLLSVWNVAETAICAAYTLFHSHQPWVLRHLSPIRFFATLWIVARQAPLSVGISRQEYWSGLHTLLHGIFSTQGLNLHLLHLLHFQVGSLPLASHVKPQQSWWETIIPIFHIEKLREPNWRHSKGQ